MAAASRGFSNISSSSDTEDSDGESASDQQIFNEELMKLLKGGMVDRNVFENAFNEIDELRKSFNQSPNAVMDMVMQGLLMLTPLLRPKDFQIPESVDPKRLMLAPLYLDHLHEVLRKFQPLVAYLARPNNKEMCKQGIEKSMKLLHSQLILRIRQDVVDFLEVIKAETGLTFGDIIEDMHAGKYGETPDETLCFGHIPLQFASAPGQYKPCSVVGQAPPAQAEDNDIFSAVPEPSLLLSTDATNLSPENPAFTSLGQLQDDRLVTHDSGSEFSNLSSVRSPTAGEVAVELVATSNSSDTDLSLSPTSNDDDMQPSEKDVSQAVPVSIKQLDVTSNCSGSDTEVSIYPDALVPYLVSDVDQLAPSTLGTQLDVTGKDSDIRMSRHPNGDGTHVFDFKSDGDQVAPGVQSDFSGLDTDMEASLYSNQDGDMPPASCKQQYIVTSGSSDTDVSLHPADGDQQQQYYGKEYTIYPPGCDADSESDGSDLPLQANSGKRVRVSPDSVSHTRPSDIELTYSSSSGKILSRVVLKSGHTGKWRFNRALTKKSRTEKEFTVHAEACGKIYVAEDDTSPYRADISFVLFIQADGNNKELLSQYTSDFVDNKASEGKAQLLHVNVADIPAKCCKVHVHMTLDRPCKRSWCLNRKMCSPVEETFPFKLPSKREPIRTLEKQFVLNGRKKSFTAAIQLQFVTGQGSVIDKCCSFNLQLQS